MLCLLSPDKTWKKHCDCRTLLQLPHGNRHHPHPQSPAWNLSERATSLPPQMGSCPTGTFCTQTKTSYGDCGVHPNLLGPNAEVLFIERCLNDSGSHTLVCLGELFPCCKPTGDPDTLLILTPPPPPTRHCFLSLCKNTLHDIRLPFFKDNLFGSSSPLYSNF